MPIARDVVEFARKLRSRSDVEPFAPEFLEILRGDAAAEGLAAELGARHGGDGYTILHLLIQSLAIQDSEDRGQTTKVELVATLPQELQYVVRRTADVVHEMINSATDEIFISGYRVTDGGLIKTLGELSSKVRDITILVNRDVRDAEKILEAWPAGAKKPSVYKGVADRDGAPAGGVLLHSKVMIVDAKEMLLTSANFSNFGLRFNFELGIRMQGPCVVEARELFRWAIQKGVVTGENGLGSV